MFLLVYQGVDVRPQTGTSLKYVFHQRRHPSIEHRSATIIGEGLGAVDPE